MIDSTTSEDWNEAVGCGLKKKNTQVRGGGGDVFIYAVGLVQSSNVTSKTSKQ